MKTVPPYSSGGDASLRGASPVPSPRKMAYSRKEAAALLGISAVSLDRLCRRGLLNPSRALRRPLFTEVEIMRFLRETQGALS
ncbi:MAG: helix-turn-helix domain-containing protein [Terrimicrobiaceae bacterium]